MRERSTHGPLKLQAILRDTRKKSLRNVVQLFSKKWKSYADDTKNCFTNAESPFWKKIDSKQEKLTPDDKKHFKVFVRAGDLHLRDPPLLPCWGSLHLQDRLPRDVGGSLHLQDFLPCEGTRGRAHENGSLRACEKAQHADRRGRLPLRLEFESRPRTGSGRTNWLTSLLITSASGTYSSESLARSE